jgi:hypothetical protein
MEYMKNSSFRENRISIPGTTPTQFSEGNTRPNWFLFVNNSATYVYVGISPNVSTTVFEQIVPPYGTRAYARPDAPLEIWLYGSGPSDLYIGSMEKDFDPTMIAQTQEIAAVNASGLLGNVNVNSILNALPAGANALGSVQVTALPALPAGGNAIGSVQVSQLPMIPAGINTIGTVNTDAVKPATSMTLYTVDMTTADTEYSQALPAGCKRFRLSMRSADAAYRLAYTTGKVAAPTEPYYAAAVGEVIDVDGIALAAQTLYFACGAAGKVIQIEAWS